MLNCPCGFGKNLKETLNKCPVCGMNLEPLKNVAHTEAQMNQLKEEHLKEAKQNKMLKKIFFIAPVLILLLIVTTWLILVEQEKEPELTVEPSIELKSAELEQLFSSFMWPEGLDVIVRYTNNVIEISGEVPTAFHKDLITALAIEKAGTERVNISNLHIVSSRDDKPPLWEDKNDVVLKVVFHYKVVAGDTLSKIARIFYGDYNEWEKIFDANQDQLSDHNYINVGQILKVPIELNDLTVSDMAERE